MQYTSRQNKLYPHTKIYINEECSFLEIPFIIVRTTVSSMSQIPRIKNNDFVRQFYAFNKFYY